MHKLRLLLSRMSEPALWTLAFLPLYMMISASLFDQLLPAWIGLLITFAFGCVIVCVRKRRFLVAVIGVLALFGSMFPFILKQLPVLVLPLLSSIVLLYTASARSMDREHTNPIVRTMVGVLFYLFAQYATTRTDLTSFSNFHMLRVPVLVGFLLFFFIEILIMNWKTIQDEAVGDSVPSSVIRHNIFLVIGAFAFAVFVACIPAIGRALSKVWAVLKRVIRAVVEFLLSLLPESQQGMGGGGGGGLSGLEGLEASEPSLLAIWLERIIAVLAGLFLLFLLFTAFRILYRKIKSLFSRLKKFLSLYMKNTSLDYVDEISDTRNTSEKNMHSFFRRKKKRPYRKDMSNTEKIRYTFGVMIDQHPDWKDSTTAREKIGGLHADIYEKVRYAEQEASDHETQVFEELLQNKKPSVSKTANQQDAVP